MSKGDAPRPLSVPREQYEIAWDRMFGTRKPAPEPPLYHGEGYSVGYWDNVNGWMDPDRVRALMGGVRYIPEE